MKKILSILLCILILTACSTSPTETTLFSGKATVTVYGLENEIIFSTETEMYVEMTALDILLDCAEEKNIPVAFTGSKSTAYVTSIGGLASGQHGDMSGWIYTLNGESIMTPCGKCILNPGDKVEWKYITEF